MKTCSGHAASAYKYNKANTVQLNLRFNKKTDADILSRLASVPNKQGYIKELIRRDNGGFEND